METPVPSVGGIQFDANGNVIASPTPVTPTMQEVVSEPKVEAPVVPVIPEVPSVPVMETPVPSVGGIQFDANGNVIASPTPVTPTMQEVVSEPKVEAPIVPVIPEVPSVPVMETPVAPTMQEIPKTTPIQEITPTTINDNLPVIEPIIITDYSKQYDPIMPNSNQAEQSKVDFKAVINEIRECSKRIEQFGYKIDVEEYDLSTIYQVVFKIEK